MIPLAMCRTVRSAQARSDSSVAEPSAAERVIEGVMARHGRIDILVNNAGIARDRALWRLTDEQWRTVLETNLTGAFHMIRALAPVFRRQHDGKIVNVSSVHGIRNRPWSGSPASRCGASWSPWRPA